jgi:hypothetical protein
MRLAIETEAQRLGATLVGSNASGTQAIELSSSSGTDTQQARLWTEAEDLAHFESLCRAVKKGAVYERESGLWLKRASRAEFEVYRAEKQRALSELAARNRKYAVKVLGGRVTNNDA